MAGLFFASFFTGTFSLLLLILAAAAVFLIGRYCGMVRRDFVIAGACFTAAAVSFGLYTTFSYNRIIAYDGQAGSFRGTVTSVKEYSGGKTVYTLKGRIDGKRSAKLRFYTDDIDAEYGDNITIDSCTFSIPRGDYLYDQGARLRSDGVFLEAENADGILLEKSSGHKIRRRIIAYRQRMCEEFRREMGTDAGDLLAGMVFGKSSELSSDVRTSFTRCGIAHILAVSGLHVSIAALLLMELLKKLRMHRLAAYGIMNVFLVLLILMADSPVSAIRAVIMLDMVYAAELFRRQNDTFTSLAAAVLIICIFDPYIIYSSGFMLSVGGTFGIGVFAPYMTKGIDRSSIVGSILSAFLTMLCTMLCILPLSLLYFDGTSLMSPVTNLVIVPFCGVLLVTGIIYVFTGGYISLLIPAKYAAETVLDLTERLSRTGAAYFSAGSDSIIRLAFLLAGAVAMTQLILRSRRVTAWAAAFGCAVLFLGSAVNSRTAYDSFRVAVLGKGNNAAVVVTYKGRADVIDLSGSSSSPDYVSKYLTSNNMSHADILVLTDNVQAQYSAYMAVFDRIDTGECFAAGDTPVYGSHDTSLFGEDGYAYSTGDYYAAYKNGVLTVRYGGSAVSFAESGAQTEDTEGMCVYYGTSPVKTENEETLYLSDYGNCFVITLNYDGGHKIRRL